MNDAMTEAKRIINDVFRNENDIIVDYPICVLMCNVLLIQLKTISRRTNKILEMFMA